MKTLQRFRTLLPLTVLFAFLFSMVAFAATPSGLVVCGNATVDGQVPLSEQCNFTDLVNQVQTIINFLIFKIASPLAAVMFAYAGFLYVTNGGNEGQIKQAHDIFLNVLLGFVIVLAAWLVMSFILTFFLGASSPFNFLG